MIFLPVLVAFVCAFITGAVVVLLGGSPVTVFITALAFGVYMGSIAKQGKS